MKKIVPFTKDIKFNTKIYEITSISLEHNLVIEDNDVITGEFVVSGEYKMNDSSINNEPFIHGLPFDITLDTKYDMDKIKIDIDDFKFEIINEEILRVIIDVLIDGVPLMVKEEIVDEITPDLIIEPRKCMIDEKENSKDEKEDIIMNNDLGLDLFKEDDKTGEKVFMEKETEIKEVTSIFNDFNDKDEKYVTYYVHIVRENDTIDSIVSKYNSDLDIIKEYNNIDQITLGDKIIIPYIENETV